MRPADVAAVVLAAGRGRRLRPLTDVAPKPLCPVANVPLIDLAFDEVVGLLGPRSADRFAVNTHHLAEAVVAHVGDTVHVSREEPVALGTAGAVGHLGTWLDGRPVLVRNGDVWRSSGVPEDFVTSWDGQRPRLLVTRDPARADFAGGWRFAGLSLIAGAEAARLPAVPAGLYETLWADAERDGRLDLVATDAAFIDCGTPGDYLAANLAAIDGVTLVGDGGTVHGRATASVVGAGAVVDGVVESSVVWPSGVVGRAERLSRVIRVGADLTVPG
jgi:MurNAc alpha-1-phosphate uridylyltransferase